jgi:hypothetical protein
MDIEKRFEALENKIIRQENKLRLHKRLWLAAACALAVVIAIGAVKPAPKIIFAENFIVTDASGVPRSTWGVTKKGDVLFEITDGKKPRLFITHRKDMAGIFIVGPDGKPRFSAGMVRGRKYKKTSPSIFFFDKQGKGLMALCSFDKNRNPAMVLFDSSEKERLVLSLTEKANSAFPSLMFHDSSGRVRTVLGVLKSTEDKKKIFINLS